jgi:predicted RNase H-like nuclease (RuvC/YqgF family)
MFPRKKAEAAPARRDLTPDPDRLVALETRFAKARGASDALRLEVDAATDEIRRLEDRLRSARRATRRNSAFEERIERQIADARARRDALIGEHSRAGQRAGALRALVERCKEHLGHRPETATISIA